MPTRQVANYFSNGGTSANNFWHPFGSSGNVWGTTQCPHILPSKITAQRLAIELSAAAGVGKSWTFDVLKNGSATGLTLTFGAADTVLSISTRVSFNQGDTIELKRSSTGAPSVPDCMVTFVWDNQTSKQSTYFTRGTNNNTSTFFGSLFAQRGLSTNTTGTPATLAGSVTRYDVNLSAAPGAGKNHVITLMKNGTAQDGSGGTPDTRVTIADSATTGNWTGTLSVSVTDIITYRVVPTGTPRRSVMAVSAIFVTTEADGNSILGAGPIANMQTSSGNFFIYGKDVSTLGWDSTEANRTLTIRCGTFSFKLKKIYVQITGGNISNALTMGPMKNGTQQGPAATVSAGTSTGNGTGEVSYADTDTWSLRSAQTGTPGVARVGVAGMNQFALTSGGGKNKKNKGGPGVTIIDAGGTSVINIGNSVTIESN